MLLASDILMPKSQKELLVNAVFSAFLVSMISAFWEGLHSERTACLRYGFALESAAEQPLLSNRRWSVATPADAAR